MTERTQAGAPITQANLQKLIAGKPPHEQLIALLLDIAQTVHDLDRRLLTLENLGRLGRRS